MRFYEGTLIPGYRLEELGRINARETAFRRAVAERVAREQLEQKARDKGADAVIGFDASLRRTFAGYECIVSGVAVKLKGL